MCKFFRFSLIFSFFSIVSAAYAGGDPLSSPPFHFRHFYAGVSVGYGETSWRELASNDDLVSVSVPFSAHDYGALWGGFLGYQFGDSFALEATYRRYPNTRISFDEYSFYFPSVEFSSTNQVYSLISKFILPFANYRLNAFLDAGVAVTHRSDVLTKVTRVAPTFGLGLMTNLSRRVIAELGFEYYVGYGKSSHVPANDYVPFLFGVYLSVGYRFL